MSTNETAQVSDAACATLEKLSDDPDEHIAELVALRVDDERLDRVHHVFGALANPDRIRLLEALRNGERCGCELMVVLDAPQSTVSTHLRRLRDAGLVKDRRKGKWTYYRIADGAVLDLLDLAVALQEE